MPLTAQSKKGCTTAAQKAKSTKRSVTTKKSAKSAKQVMKKPASMKVCHRRRGQVATTLKREIMSLPKQHLLTAMLQLLESSSTSFIQLKRKELIHRELERHQPMEDAPIETTGDLVAKWQEAIAGATLSIEMILRTILQHTGCISKGSRCPLLTREPETRSWSRGKKKGTHVAGSDVKTTRAINVPYQLGYNVGKWKTPKGQGQYPKFTKLDVAQGPTLRDSKNMRELRKLCEMFSGDALAFALTRFAEEHEEGDFTKDCLTNLWWWGGRVGSWKPGEQEVARAERLLTMWNQLMESKYVTKAMVVRTSIMTLRIVQAPSKKCSMCSSLLEANVATKPDDWVSCPHKFCGNCLRGRAQALDGGCALCETKQMKLVLRRFAAF